MRKLENFPYQNVLVLGLARSGTAAATLLLKSGVSVRVNDQSMVETPEIQLLKKLGADIVLGSHPLSVLENIQVIVKNPGIPYDHPLIEQAEKLRIPIITEIELAGRVFHGPIIGITGSNGKTTTTTLISQMLSNSNQQVEVAGNIGKAASEIAPNIAEETNLVLELSSFQLLGITTFKPKIAVLLNLYEAHLDYHKKMENYIQAKFNIFMNQTEDDYLVYNSDDDNIKKGIVNTRAIRVPFSLTKCQVDGAWFDDTYIYFRDEKIIKKSQIVLAGEHHMENILASICVAKLSGTTNEAIKKTLTTFTGVKHRLQFVENINGRLFYNDSKATNMLATEKALLSFEQPIILLAGGLDRGDDLKQLIPFLSNVKKMIVFGQTAKKLKVIGEKTNIPVKIVNDVIEATYTAYEQSQDKDVILLSPACASWDQYKTFEERGDMFINTVHKLK